MALQLIVGLGNPGPQYAVTRHNIGFLVLDALAAREHVAWQRRFFGRYTEVVWEGQRVALLEPLTFMNRSGEAVAACVEALDVALDSLVVVHDDLDLAWGALRLAFDRGAGGHRGVLSIGQYLESSAYWRLRCGIDRPPRGADPADYVLQPLGRELQERVDELTSSAIEALLLCHQEGPAAVQRRFHRNTAG